MKFRFLSLFLAFVVIALPSCSLSGEGVSGGVYYFDDDFGAKAGLRYEDGEGRAYARKDFHDPLTGEFIARTEIEKRFGKKVPVVNATK